MKSILPLLMAFIATTVGYSCTDKDPEVSPFSQQFVEEKCWFPSDKDWPDSICGRMFVPENRAKPDSPLISFPVIRFKSKIPDEGKYPVLVAGGGGPGNPLGLGEPDISRTIWETYYYMSVGSGRDLVLIDNRGVGLSQPRLACPEVEKEFITMIGQRPSLEDRLVRSKYAYGACKKRLEQEGIDLGQYNNMAAAKDIEELRQALGIKKWNLYGVSYGTRIALSVVREFPETIHAVLLDSVDPPEIQFLEESPKDNEASFDNIMKACEKSVSCRKLLPEFRETLLLLIEKLRNKPEVLFITNPRNYAPLKVVLNDEILIGTIFSAGMFKEYIERIPLVVRSLWEGNLDLIGSMIREVVVIANTVKSIDMGAYASYGCYDETPFNSLKTALGEAPKYPIQKSMNIPWIQEEKAMCEVWDVQPGSEVESLPLVSDVSVLLYAGEFDPVTPPRWAMEARKHLSNSFIKIWAGTGHAAVFSLYCADRTAQIFFDNPNIPPWTDSCIAKADKRHLSFQEY